MVIRLQHESEPTGNLLDRLLCLTLRVSHLVGPVRSENLNSNKFPGGANTASLGPYSENHLSIPPSLAGFYWATVGIET